jgi:hypothetical protein
MGIDGEAAEPHAWHRSSTARVARWDGGVSDGVALRGRLLLRSLVGSSTCTASLASLTGGSVCGDCVLMVATVSSEGTTATGSFVSAAFLARCWDDRTRFFAMVLQPSLADAMNYVYLRVEVFWRRARTAIVGASVRPR